MAYVIGATWINDGKTEKVVGGDELEIHYEDGWKKGMLASMAKPEPKAKATKPQTAKAKPAKAKPEGKTQSVKE